MKTINVQAARAAGGTMKKLSILLCVVAVLSGFALTAPGVFAETVACDYQLPGTKLHFDNIDLARGQVTAELHPAGESDWAEGEPITVKLIFSNIAALPE